MAIKTGEYLNTKDIYIDYPFEDVMFRRMKNDGAIYRKFYGEQESSEVISDDNRLFNEALLSGDEITKEEYEAGKKG
ncbi:hypothetical protein [Shewanella algae]|uniref:hypothetical protein n=1 Tax=Shewanella algae TaxID=38313 RepID=UPI0031F501DA